MRAEEGGQRARGPKPRLGHREHEGQKAGWNSGERAVKGFKSQMRSSRFILQELGSYQRHFYFIFLIKEP